MPQFPALCPLTHAVVAPWLLNEHTLLEAPGVEGLLLDSSQGTLYSYIQYMALRNLYFQSNFSEDGCNQPTNERIQSEAEFTSSFSLKLSLLASRAGSHVEPFLETQLSHFHSLGHFMPGCWMRGT